MMTTKSAWTAENAAERAARREKIATHIEANTCHICEQHVEDGSPIHGPTGAHWECHQGPVEACTRTASEPQQTSVPKPDLHPRLARANGGTLVHFVIPATATSLCGHKPRDTAHHMKRRGKWLVFKIDAAIPSHLKHCQKCLAKAEILYPPVEGELVSNGSP